MRGQRIIRSVGPLDADQRTYELVLNVNSMINPYDGIDRNTMGALIPVARSCAAGVATKNVAPRLLAFFFLMIAPRRMKWDNIASLSASRLVYSQCHCVVESRLHLDGVQRHERLFFPSKYEAFETCLTLMESDHDELPEQIGVV